MFIDILWGQAPKHEPLHHFTSKPPLSLIAETEQSIGLHVGYKLMDD